MKSLLLSALLVLSSLSFAQTKLTMDYETYAYYIENESNKNTPYIWLYDGETYVMNFPKTITGLEALRDKVEYIADLSNVLEPTTDNSIRPSQYKEIEDLSVIYNLIMDGKISIFCTYVIGDRRMEVTSTKYGFYLYITDND